MKPILLASIAAGLLPLSAQAVIVANYTFSETATQTSYANSASVPNISASALSAGSGTSLGSTASGQDGRGVFFTAGTLGSDSEAAAFANNDYFTFTLTADAGFKFDANTLSFAIQRTNSPGPNSSNPNRAFLRSDVGGDNFSTTLALVTLSTNLGNYQTYSIGLTSISALQNVSSATQLRVYFFNTIPLAHLDSFRMDNVNLDATVSVIPEASAFATLAGLAAIGIAASRRRSRGPSPHAAT